MDPKTPKNKEKPKQTNVNTASQPSYLIVHAIGEKSLLKCSPFLIQKLFESTIGHLNKTQKLRSGDLLVETASPQQSAKLLAAKKLGDIEVTVTPHGSLNSSRSVISEAGLMSEDESDILMGLSDQGVTNVRRISICRDGRVIPTKHLILTFNKPTLHLLLQQDICIVQFDHTFQTHYATSNASSWTFTDILPWQECMCTVWG
ncbi:uncharacterized protein LOC111622893 [Centruroides sculpturatus]|uniref:uncharacterized protein LOC111622893 n=1 Tax=Centruroides sculpturatus TaxID=218467 RepID=UPI000C6D7FCA|nr:uncharacterized protein LOC111622893 [Centruroides sculpturatus]